MMHIGEVVVHNRPPQMVKNPWTMYASEINGYYSHELRHYLSPSSVKAAEQPPQSEDEHTA